jgi:hypothetical protein
MRSRKRFLRGSGRGGYDAVAYGLGLVGFSLSNRVLRKVSFRRSSTPISLKFW